MKKAIVHLKSAQAAGRGVKRMRNSAELAAPGESVVRESLMKSAQAAGRGVKRMRNSAELAAPGDSVVREFLKKSDPVLGGIIDRVGPYKIQYRDPIFQTLVRSIVYQQLHGKAALSIFNRLMAAARAEPLTPEAILHLRPAKMRALGLSPQKLTYIRELARMTRSGDVDFEACAALEDGAVVEHLTRVKGIGVWTVQMFLIFALRRPDVLPTGDLGVRAAIKKAYNLVDLPKPVEMERLAAAWRPYCSVASWYLWRSLENQGAM